MLLTNFNAQSSEIKVRMNRIIKHFMDGKTVPILRLYELCPKEIP